MRGALDHAPSPRAWLVALGLAAAALYLVGLGRTDLWAPDEPRYAHVAAQLFSLEHGAQDLVVMRVNGEPYTQKPPLYFWLAALASVPAGAVSETTARLPSALAGVATVMLTFLLGQRMLGWRAGAWGAAFAGTVFDFAFLARRARLDVLLTLCAVIALTACWRALGEGRRTRGNVALLHGAMGLGTLVKGPVALLPLLAAAVFLAWERRLRELRSLVPAWSWLLSLGLPLLWVAGAVALTPQGFFYEAVVQNTAGRFVGEFSKVEPFYYFAYQFPVNFLPWTVLWPLVALELWRRGKLPPEEREHASAWRFLLAWVGTWFVFFSLSHGKRGLYLIPCFPAAALLCAAALESWLGRRAELGVWLRRGLAAAFALVAAVGVAFLVRSGAPFPRAPEVATPGAFGAALVVLALLAAGCWLLLARRGARLAGPLVATVALVATVELAVFDLLHPAFEPLKSPRPIAEAAAALVPEGGRIGLYGHSAMIGGLAFYGHRRVAYTEEVSGVRDFFAEGGRVLATRTRNLRRLGAVVDLEEVARFRSGRRSYSVVRPSGPDVSARTGP